MSENYPQGHFCWTELCSSDWQGGKTFYSDLFTWSAEDQPIGNGLYYTMLKKPHGDVAAMYQMPADQHAQGVPSYWLSYIAVDDVDAMADKAKSLGATIVHGPHDVPEAGRMVLLCDPVGAMVALWQGQGHKGASVQNEVDTPCWFELATRDIESSTSFYSELLGWRAELKAMEGMDYTLFKAGDTMVGGMVAMDEQWPDDIPPHWMIYFSVNDCDAQAEQAKKLGGEVCVQPMDVPEVGRFCVLTDPQGAVFSIINLNQ
ncbi:27 kDa antigen Cfp30B [Pseudoalteromonas sp. THAF3]|uniref:VOC family protein n=1 Tax=Pseudoalteromonas sp. THAF3 TaxID=2587843 RepID=UPI0012685AE0|nr:VOC family protein [Pseudoalteromonas sp. THAF3]QFU03497.1 27 kDa antigen Cfp30B [Pseudoalteromonas sp. THAF3]